MTRTEGQRFRLLRCRSCGAETKGNPDPTLSPGVVLAYCVACKRRMPAEDLGPAEIVPVGRTGFLPGGRYRAETRDGEVGIYATRPRCEIPGCGDVQEAHGLCSGHLTDDEAGMGDLAEDPEPAYVAEFDGGIRMPIYAPEDEDRIQAAYRAWRGTPDGLSVVAAIRRRAIELRRRGWRTYGIQALAEVARFDRSLSAGPDAAGFKVNNSHLSRLARDLMDEEPELRGFFVTRELVSQRESDS